MYLENRIQKRSKRKTSKRKAQKCATENQKRHLLYVTLYMQETGKARKSTGRMPWHWEPMKDVISCEKLRGGANIH